jgi:large subunit ribosomal protein L4
MAHISVMTPSGVASGTVELPESVFGVQPNVPVMHQVVTAQLAARRAGTQSTKTRAEVSGTGKKPFKQKGTGNARQGTLRGPHMSGGGVALGPKPRKYTQKTPKKMIALALRSALSDRAAAGKVVVVESWGWSAPKTTQAIAAIKSLGLTGRVLVVVDPSDEATIKSFRNLPSVQILSNRELNAYDVLCNDYVVFSKDVLPAAVVAKERAVVVAKAAPVRKAVAVKAPAAADEATVTTTVTVRTIVDGVETVEVLERSVDHVAADSIADTNPDAIETTVHTTEQTIVGGKVVDSSESFTTEESDS